MGNATAPRLVVVLLALGGAMAMGGCAATAVREPAPMPAESGSPAGAGPSPAAAPADSGDTARASLSPPEETGPAERGGRGGVGAQAEKAAAQHFYEVGKRFFDQLEYQKAYDNLRRAIELDPTHEAAVDLYMRAGAVLGIREDELRAALEQFVQERRVKIELMRQEMLRFYEAGLAAFEAGRYDQAIRDLERALEIIAWEPALIDQRDVKSRAEKMLAEAKRKQLYQELQERDRLERQAIDLAQKAERARQEREERRVATLLRQTSDLLQAQRYQEAEKLAQQILELDPRNLWAKKYREFARKGIHLLTAARIFEEGAEAEWQRQHNLEVAAIPREHDYIRFPDDWIERTRLRRPGVAVEALQEPFWVERYRQTLAERKVSVDFPGVTLRDAIRALGEITGLNFVIHQNVDADAITVSLKLSDISLENALKIILEQAGLTYVFDAESIMVLQPGTLPGDVYFEIYDISDILHVPKDFTAHRISLPEDERRAAGGGAGPSPFVFGDEGGAAGGEPLTGDRLVEIVRDATGGDEAWTDPNQIEPHRGQLLVTATRELHRRVREVLDALRQNQGLFVHIEARFIEVESDKLEDIGIDFRGLGTVQNFQTSPINMEPPVLKDPSGNIQPNPGRAHGIFTSPPPVDAGGAHDVSNSPNVGTDNFVLRSQHIFGGTAGPILSGQRLRGGGGLTLQISTLDDFQINAILRAEAEQAWVRRLAAPRVTAANRQKVYFQQVNQRSYIRDWELISGGTGLSVVEVPDPVVDTFQDGVMLEVRPTVSSDRKYVTLDLRPAVSTLVGGQIFSVNVSLGSANAAAIDVPIELPELTLQEAFTSVTIPDGGTALLGGLREIRQRREESTLPFVDNIPLLNLLFKRQAEIEETSTLAILVTAKIVSVREEERELYNRE
ncbi:MAG: hypothetical protein KatS3mg102_2151 [Planctomycetota bacterium]|nr:MAG: hypothetical protein KatS3mg102_2151 [Planctomycetota bacterium]